MLFSAAVACACLSALTLAAEAAASEYIADTEHFPGWKGALPAVERAGVDAEDRHSRTLSVGALGKVRACCAAMNLRWSFHFWRILALASIVLRPVGLRLLDMSMPSSAW